MSEDDIDIYWVDLCEELRDTTGTRKGNAVRLGDYEILEVRVQELLEALDQCIAYIKTGNHKTLDMEFILSVAKLREGEDVISNIKN